LRLRGDHRHDAIESDQHTAHDGRGIKPGQVDLKAWGRQRAVEQAELEAIPRHQQTDRRNQCVIETVNPELGDQRQSMHEHSKGEMGPRSNADRRADQCEPGQRQLTNFFDPGKRYRIDIEPIGYRADEIAQDHADQQVGDGKYDQRRDRDFRDG